MTPEGKRDSWDKAAIILQPVGGLLTALAIGLFGYFSSDFLNRRQAIETNMRLYSELMSRREESESALRKDMFVSIISSFLQPASGDLAADVLNLELLAPNFHELLNLKPLFIDLKRRIKKSEPAARSAADVGGAVGPVAPEPGLFRLERVRGGRRLRSTRMRVPIPIPYTYTFLYLMGLYLSDVDRIGMLSYDAWGACRLVVDTGMHDMGWSRQQAIDYMKENTVLAENNIVNEVDRYLTWPGQALAYKCGQLEILKLRDEGKQRLGDRLDIKQFHEVVLKNGAVALPVLRQQVEAYYAEAERAK